MQLWLQRDMKSSPSLEPVMKRDRFTISQNGIVSYLCYEQQHISPI
jgi:hypothetical protein